MNHLLSVVMLFQSSSQGGGTLGFLLPMILIFVVMYFLIFRPQAKKQKEHQKMVASITKGDKVVTSGGIYGTVAGVKEKEKIIIVKIADNVKVELSQSSISRKIE